MPTGINTGQLQIANDNNFLYLIWNGNPSWTSKKFYVIIAADQPPSESMAYQRYPIVVSTGQRVPSVEIRLSLSHFSYFCGESPLLFIGFYLEAVRESDGRSFGSYLDSGFGQRYYDYSMCCCSGYSHLQGIINVSDAIFPYPSLIPLDGGGR